MQKGWWLMLDKLIWLQHLFYEKPQMNLFSLFPESGALYWWLTFTDGILRNPQMISLGVVSVVICRWWRKEVNKNMIWHFISNARDGCAQSRGNEYCTCWSASNKGKCIACADLQPSLPRTVCHSLYLKSHYACDSSNQWLDLHPHSRS